MMERSYYETLGVTRTATGEEIKKVYRQLALRYHPDRNPGDKDAEETFKRVQEAYDVVSDPLKRSEYDLKGYVGRRPPPTPPPPARKPRYKTADDFRREHEEEERKKSGTSYTQAELDAVQCQFFGGGGDGGVIGRNILINLILKKDQLGQTHRVKVKKRMVCILCSGFGVAAFNRKIACRDCGGSGYLFEDKQIPSMSADCPTCGGDGGFDTPCTCCGGAGLAGWTIAHVDVFVPKNHVSGTHIVIRSKGEQGKGGGIAGNVHVAAIVQ